MGGFLIAEGRNHRGGAEAPLSVEPGIPFSALRVWGAGGTLHDLMVNFMMSPRDAAAELAGGCLPRPLGDAFPFRAILGNALWEK